MAGARQPLGKRVGSVVRDHAAEFRRLFDIVLAEEGLPLLMHCTSGKDRTGFAAAALLLAAGVPRDVIVEDYAITNLYRRDIAHLFSNEIARDAIEMLTAADPRYIETALDEIDRLSRKSSSTCSCCRTASELVSTPCRWP